MTWIICCYSLWKIKFRHAQIVSGFGMLQFKIAFIIHQHLIYLKNRWRSKKGKGETYFGEEAVIYCKTMVGVTRQLFSKEETLQKHFELHYELAFSCAKKIFIMIRDVFTVFDLLIKSFCWFSFLQLGNLSWNKILPSIIKFGFTFVICTFTTAYLNTANINVVLWKTVAPKCQCKQINICLFLHPPCFFLPGMYIPYITLQTIRILLFTLFK